MGKQKQQVISRFFAPKPAPSSAPTNESSPPSCSPSCLKSSPRITTTVSFSPSSTASRRSHPQSPSVNPSPKRPKLSFNERLVSKLPDPPASSSLPPSRKPLAQNPKYTPLEQQVLELKSDHPDVLLMVEVGYRYRFFGEDAETAARILGIVSHFDHNFLTASIPTFRLNVHVRRLVNAGYKVGVVKQTETAAIKAHGSNRLGPFTRGLSALYTRSTIEAAEGMEGGGEEEILGSGGNYLLCVVEKEVLNGEKGSAVADCFDVKIGIVGVEISTGEVIHGEFNDYVTRSALEAVVLSLSPVEILLGEPLSASTEKLLLSFAATTSNIRVERTTCNYSSDGGALAELMSLYEDVADGSIKAIECSNGRNMVDASSGFEGILSMPELSVQALATTMRYMKKFGLEKILCMGASFRPFFSNVELTLSANTLHQLEVLKNNYNGSIEGSLLHAMDRTSTSFGSRLLKHWVTHPLCDRNSILARLDAVAEIAESMDSIGGSQAIVLAEENCYNALAQTGIGSSISQVIKMLAKSPDIQRGIARIFHRTAEASEFIGVIQAILMAGKQLQKLYEDDNGNDVTPQGNLVKSALLRRLIFTASSSSLISHAAKLLSSLNKDAANQSDVLNLFNASGDQFPEVVSGKILVEIEKEKLDSLIGQYRKQLGMFNLNFICVAGVTHLIELSSDARVPSNWVKVNSTKKTVRYHPPEVLAALDKLVLAKEEFSVTCRKTWANFLAEFGKYYAQFQSAVQALAALDCLHSLAILSRNQKYVRPTFTSNEEPCQIYISSGRHAVLESILGDNFVPNDTYLHADGEHCQIITGPNMGGKSCYIRQVALIVIMAQVGSFVPAYSANLHVIDGIYTRMGASDRIQHGTSTFFEEVRETSYIMEHCTPNSLVIIDELGRGTSTHDGVAIAYATLHYILQQKKSMTLFVTHYPQILDIQREFEGSVGAYHVSYLTVQKPSDVCEARTEADVVEAHHISHLTVQSSVGVCELRMESDVESVCDQEVTFLYKVVRGASGSSFGLNVARLAQLPDSCIRRAALISAKLEEDTCSRLQNRLEPLIRQPAGLLQASANSSDHHKGSSKENGEIDELAKACFKVLSFIKSAAISAETDIIFSNLERATDFARLVIKYSFTLP
ncbi:hypothetical protein HPP92_020859 [Vanilla planifolia]|uniref:DNA mismatch repair protein n=1 Tax=Vanilla planifolia TaxID=51239 RepID=A0A835PZX8_VANPL|nr:hypothetical protein HPP92_020859 [Vanilla planifolia]